MPKILISIIFAVGLVGCGAKNSAKIKATSNQLTTTTTQITSADQHCQSFFRTSLSVCIQTSPLPGICSKCRVLAPGLPAPRGSQYSAIASDRFCTKPSSSSACQNLSFTSSAGTNMVLQPIFSTTTMGTLMPSSGIGSSLGNICAYFRSDTFAPCNVIASNYSLDVIVPIQGPSPTPTATRTPTPNPTPTRTPTPVPTPTRTPTPTPTATRTPTPIPTITPSGCRTNGSVCHWVPVTTPPVGTVPSNDCCSGLACSGSFNDYACRSPIGLGCGTQNQSCGPSGGGRPCCTGKTCKFATSGRYECL